MQSNHKRLLSYSVMAGAVTIFAEHVQAQIIYHDIDPDTILELIPDHGSDYLEYMIDIDFNGEPDFRLNIGFFDACAYCEPNTWGAITPYGGNEIAIEKFGWATTFGYNTGSDYFVQPLETNASVNDDLNFSTSFVKLNDEVPGYDYGSLIQVGPWHVDAVRFIGFKLEGKGYGWMRLICDNTYLRIFDFAYFEDPDEKILAGEGVGLSAETDQFADTEIFYTSHHLMIIGDQGELHDASVIISNSSGQNVFQARLHSAENQFELHLAAGMYFISIKNDSGFITSQIAID